jgi:hypothetical protein
MTWIPDGPLELVQRLLAEPEQDRATLERMFDLHLREVETVGNPDFVVGNPYYVLYEGKPENPAWLSRLELRRARWRTASLLILEIEPEPCHSPDVLLTEYGQPEVLNIPAPHGGHSGHGGPRSAYYYRYTRGSDDLSFGFQRMDQGSCLNAVVLDRTRNRCVEVRTIQKNTVAQFGEGIRIGGGNIWEGEYESGSGEIKRGLSAGISVVVRDRPAEELRLRVGPGSRFEAGGQSFRVEGVAPDSVTLCRLTPSSSRAHSRD